MPDGDEALGLMEWQRLQQHAVHHAEDRSIGADPQREGDGRHSCEARLLPQHARGIAQVLEETGEHMVGGNSGCDGRRAVRLTQRSHLLRKCLGFAQFLQRQTTRLAFKGSSLAELLISLVEMLRQLFDDLRLPLRPQSQAAEASAQILGPLRHGRLR